MMHVPMSDAMHAKVLELGGSKFVRGCIQDCLLYLLRDPDRLPVILVFGDRTELPEEE
jgi:hypothetical protein